jgi:hypothetical protein
MKHKLITVQLTQHEWQQATRGNVYMSKKKYNRKKQKTDYKRQNPEFD